MENTDPVLPSVSVCRSQGREFAIHCRRQRKGVRRSESECCKTAKQSSGKGTLSPNGFGSAIAICAHLAILPSNLRITSLCGVWMLLYTSIHPLQLINDKSKVTRFICKCLQYFRGAFNKHKERKEMPQIKVICISYTKLLLRSNDIHNFHKIAQFYTIQIQCQLLKIWI